MKKFVYLFLAVAVSLAVVSCGNKKEKKEDEVKKAENFADLKKKFDGKEFKTCDEFIAAADEMIDVMVSTAKKAGDGDEKAKAEFKEIKTFLDQFNDQAEKFETECPDKMDEFSKKMEDKLKPINDLLMKLTFEMMEEGTDAQLQDTLGVVSEQVDNKLESLKSNNNDALNKLKNK